jgi:hypothetical protein
MHKHLSEIASDDVELGQTDVLDLLNDMVPVDTVFPLPTREAAQKLGLVSRPGEDVTIVEVVRHNLEFTLISDRARAKPSPVIAGTLSIDGVTSGLCRTNSMTATS